MVLYFFKMPIPNESLDMYIQNSNIVYTMQKSKNSIKKMLPVKLDPQLYADLKFVAVETNTTMAAIIRNLLKSHVALQATAIKKAKKNQLALSDYFKKNAYSGNLYHAQKNIDELVYEDKV